MKVDLPGSFYEHRFHRLMDAGEDLPFAAEHAALAYLDGKPALRGKQKVTGSERDAAFWSSRFLINLPAPAWQSQAMMLVLAQYMSQEGVANMVMLANVAAVAPDVLVRAVRRSGLVLTRHSPRRTELDYLAVAVPAVAEQCKVLGIFDVAHRHHQRRRRLVSTSSCL